MDIGQLAPRLKATLLKDMIDNSAKGRTAAQKDCHSTAKQLAVTRQGDRLWRERRVVARLAIIAKKPATTVSHRLFVSGVLPRQNRSPLPCRRDRIAKNGALALNRHEQIKPLSSAAQQAKTSPPSPVALCKHQWPYPSPHRPSSGSGLF